MNRLHIYSVAFFVVLVSSLGAEEPAALSPEQLRRLGAELDANNYQTRVRATEKLRLAREAALETVENAAASGGTEGATRALTILKVWLLDDDAALRAKVTAAVKRLAQNPSATVAKRAQALEREFSGREVEEAIEQLYVLGAHLTGSEDATEKKRVITAGIDTEWRGRPEDIALLAKIPSLEELSFTSRPTGEWLKQLSGSSIKELTVGNPDLDDRDVGQLPVLPQLSKLTLSRTMVSDKGLAHLAKMPQLETLLLQETLVNDSGLASLKAAPSLRHLQLSGTLVSSQGFKVLAEFPKLETLDVRQTKFSGVSLEALAASKTLRKIEAENSGLTGADVAAFRKAHPGTSLEVSVTVWQVPTRSK